MKRLFLPTVAVVVLGILCGCGGETFAGPCGGADWGQANPTYAGHYTGTFHLSDPHDPAAKDLTVDLTVAVSGTVTGTVHEVGSEQTASVTGNAGDWMNPCSADQTWIDLHFTFGGGADRQVSGNRALGQTQPWTFSGSYKQGATSLASGTLTLTKGD